MTLAAIGSSSPLLPPNTPPGPFLVSRPGSVLDSAWGQYDEAIAQLDSVLSVPAEISTYSLLTDPTWAPLRTSKRFQDLIRKYSR